MIYATVVFLFLFTFLIGFLFYLLTRRTIAEVYHELTDKNRFFRGIKAFFIGIYRILTSV
ncbi:hypothetical protein I8F93_11345 [Enterococcus gallinarum]|nr:hypothetical protein [Enterococcus gallinarum]